MIGYWAGKYAQRQITSILAGIFTHSVWSLVFCHLHYQVLDGSHQGLLYDIEKSLSDLDSLELFNSLLPKTHFY